jgi:hypothetical protein
MSKKLCCSQHDKNGEVRHFLPPSKSFSKGDSENVDGTPKSPHVKNSI